MRCEVITGIVLANKEAIENDKKDAKVEGIDNLDVRLRGTRPDAVVSAIFASLWKITWLKKGLSGPIFILLRKFSQFSNIEVCLFVLMDTFERRGQATPLI